MRKNVLLLVACLLMSAQFVSANVTEWSGSESGKIKAKWKTLFGKNKSASTDAEISMNIAYQDGSAFDLDYINKNWYGDEDSILPVLHLEQNKYIDVTIGWSGLSPDLANALRFGADFMVWEGEGTEAASDAIYQWSNYICDSGSMTFSMMYSADCQGDNLLIILDGNIFTCPFNYVDACYFDIFAQANATGNDNNNGKLGIGARLDFCCQNPLPGDPPVNNPVPAPGALVLSSLGTAVVGWIRRKK